MAGEDILLVDDEIVDFDPEASPDDWVEPEPEYLGQLGYYIWRLKEAGFRVTTAPGVDEALQIVDTNREFDLFVLDVMMPPSANVSQFSDEHTATGTRTGFALAEELHRKRPDVPIVLLSNIVPSRDALTNRSTIDELMSKGVVVDVIAKLDCPSGAFVERVAAVLDSE